MPASSSSTHRHRLREATSAAVLDAAERVIAEQGVAGAAMQAIAQSAGVAVGTLYNHFGDRVGLLRALVTRHRDLLASAIEAAAKPERDFEAAAVDFVDAVLRLFDARRDFVRAALDSELWRALLQEPHVSSPPGARVRQQIDDRAHELMCQGVDEGRMRVGEGELLGAFFSGAVRGVLLQRARRETNPPARDVALAVVQLFLRGAAAPEAMAEDTCSRDCAAFHGDGR